jgi:exodeoxyribonuclease VII large subunit
LLLSHYASKIISPQQTIFNHWQKLDFLERQLTLLCRQTLGQKQQQLQLALSQLQAKNPQSKLQYYQSQLTQLAQRMEHSLDHYISQWKLRFQQQLSTLEALSPLKTLQRGFSIATTHGKILYRSTDVAINDTIQIQLAKGRLDCLVTHIKEPPPDAC